MQASPLTHRTGGHDGAPIGNHLPSLGAAESRYVAEALASGWISYAGPYVARFEQQLAAALGFEQAVSLASGTCALQLAFELIDAPGTGVLMPALTFAAPASAIVRAGMTPIFVDLAAGDWQLDARRLEVFLAERCRPVDGGIEERDTGRIISTLCVVHLFGGLADIDRLHAIAARHGLHVVHDMAQCLGASFAGEAPGRRSVPAGAGHVLATTSFNANKIVTTGAGGALLGNDPALIARARHVSSTAKTNPYSFEHDAYGLNLRMSNLCAALGVAQLERLETMRQAKRRIDRRYREAIPRLMPAARFAILDPRVEDNAWMSTVRLPGPAEPVIRALQADSIQVRPLWVPLPDLPIYRGFAGPGAFEVADDLWRRAMMLPSGADLTDAQVDRVVDAIAGACR